MSDSTLRPMNSMDMRGWQRGPLLVIAGLAAIGIATFVAGSDKLIHPVSTHGPSAVVVERDLRFVDRPDGGVGVINAGDGSTAIVFPKGQDNFVRATMRGLARQRIRAGIGAELPFHLTAYEDGRLVLVDPGTGREVELESFGETNEADFARMLPLVVPPSTGVMR